MRINEMVRAAHEQAVKSGWWEYNRSPLEIAALLHSEASEFVEEARKGRPAVYVLDPDGKQVTIEHLVPESFTMVDGTPMKPEGQLIEIADILIRCADYCGRMGWDLSAAVQRKMEFNRTRPIRHGKLC